MKTLEDIKIEIENIQFKVDSVGFMGANEHDLHLRDEIAQYIFDNFVSK